MPSLGSRPCAKDYSSPCACLQPAVMGFPADIVRTPSMNAFTMLFKLQYVIFKCVHVVRLSAVFLAAVFISISVS